MRKEAYSLRGKSANEDPTDDIEDPLNTSNSSISISAARKPPSNSLSSSSSSSSSSYKPSSSTTSSMTTSSTSAIKLKEDWEKWYPMEWIAWVAYGAPAPDPVEHWTTENISDGPKSISMKKKPAGRVDQRKKEVELKATTTNKTNNSTIQTMVAQNELAIASRQDDLIQINLLLQHARTDEKRVSFITKFGIFI